MECDPAKWAEMREYKDYVYLLINFDSPLPPRTWEYLHYVNALGSRAIALIGKGDTMKEARDIIENDANNIFGPLFMRKDIGYDETFETYKNISKYEGEITNGLPNGQGTDTVPKGEKYVGSWKVGNRDGQGTLTWSDGSKFVGEFKNGKRNGQGTETFGKGKWKGDKYVGEYKDDNKNGQGTYTFSNGWKFVVEYKDGEVLNGTFYDKDGNIIKKYVNGKSIKQ